MAQRALTSIPVPPSRPCCHAKMSDCGRSACSVSLRERGSHFPSQGLWKRYEVLLGNECPIFLCGKEDRQSNASSLLFCQEQPLSCHARQPKMKLLRRQRTVQHCHEIEKRNPMGILCKVCEIKARVGIRSGPVLAGAVDEKMPKYHLSGDTVNKASWTESHSLPRSIHLSLAAFRALPNQNFKTHERRETEEEVKGKRATCFLRKNLPGTEDEIKASRQPG
ncbi:receptor-type guanylate cyclase gcy-12-like [Accipiter gentilis]|uniref:receptor-type guanylate cyclase gcy-12-like n=1 Tax=Astur gentilis TaxID=8957 RepID=UPI0021105E7F|nr:receptor-type guanylate cyclase gcy-12-like [Accipiter gentilis]